MARSRRGRVSRARPRRSKGKRRSTIRRRVTRRPRMGRRSILNITSIKKHDNMLPAVVGTPGSAPVLGPILMPATTAFLFCPTARPVGTFDVGEVQRTRQLTFSRGYREKVQFALADGTPWIWRRIVFTYKGPDFYGASGSQLPWLDVGPAQDSNMQRLIAPLAGTQYVNLRAILYDGNEGVDWFNQFTAKVDTSRVSLRSDRTISINPGNDAGKNLSRTFWYPTNKNLLYDDDEDGSASDANFVSVKSKIGMGDLYVYDVFGPSKAGSQPAVFQTEGTYYWHEK